MLGDHKVAGIEKRWMVGVHSCPFLCGFKEKAFHVPFMFYISLYSCMCDARFCICVFADALKTLFFGQCGTKYWFSSVHLQMNVTLILSRRGSPSSSSPQSAGRPFPTHGNLSLSSTFCKTIHGPCFNITLDSLQ